MKTRNYKRITWCLILLALSRGGSALGDEDKILKRLRADPTDQEAYDALAHSRLVSGAPVLSPAAVTGRPYNLIIISIDTLRADGLHCYGNPRETSPAIDRFSRTAVKFDNVISQAPETAPSHMSIFTGMLPDLHMVANRPDQGVALSPAIPTLAQYLKASGYLTVGITGGGVLVHNKGFERDFDIYLPAFEVEKYSKGGPLIPPEISQALDSAVREGKPLFLFLHHYYVHFPYVTGPPELRTRFLTPDVKVEGLPVTEADIAVEGGFWRNIDLARSDHRAHVRALYDGGVLIGDFIFERIESLLKDKGMFDNSLIILTSDHGEEFGEHGKKEHGNLWVEHLRVPLFIRFPQGDFGGREVEREVRLVDLAPFILEFLHIQPAVAMQGHRLCR